MKNTAEFCTCRHTKCPRHPMNNEKSRADCIEKNLRLGEITGCFFDRAGISEDRPDDSFETFAREMLKNEN